MKQLKIYFSGLWRDAASPCPWALCEANGTVLQSGTSLLAGLPKDAECIGIIASEKILSLSLPQPAGAKRRWQAALPFMVEEYCLQDPEEQHVVPAGEAVNGQLPLYVLNKNWLTQLLDSCQSSGLKLRRLIAESELLKADSQHWKLVWQGNNGFMLCGPHQVLPLDELNESQPPLALQLRLQQQTPQQIDIHYSRSYAEQHSSAPNWPDFNIPLRLAETWDWRRQAIPTSATNLLWGELAPKARITEYWPAVKPLVYLSCVLLGIHIVLTNIHWLLLSQQQQALKQQMERDFRATFGASSMLVNAPLQMQRNLTQLRHQAGLPDQSDLLPMLDQLSPALASLPPGSIRQIHYEAGQLDLQLRLAQAADFGALQLRLKQQGLNAQWGEIQNLGSGAESKLSLRAGATP